MIQRHQYQYGFSLIEILISVLVMSAGLIGLGGLQLMSLKSTSNAYYQNTASMLALELSDRMRANKQGVAAGYYDDTIDCKVRETVCRGEQVCTPEQTARFDLQTLSCGIITNGISHGGARHLLPQGELTVTCPTGCDQSKAMHQITIRWGEGNIHKDQEGLIQNASLTVEVIP